jgi:NAD(P)-dependent dehydrogenase (short-subunit alcohol dehydrogenase family)
MLQDGRTAAIVGAGGAIGSHVAREFAREGAAVFLAGRHSDTRFGDADHFPALRPTDDALSKWQVVRGKSRWLETRHLPLGTRRRETWLPPGPVRV